MGFMGPMQVESIGGKRYVYVVLMTFQGLIVLTLSKKNQTLFMFSKICVNAYKGISIM